MKAAFKTLLGVALVLSVAVLATAEEKKKEAKEVTLKGELSCAKCVLKIDGITKCTNAITVKEDGKDVVYILAKDKGRGAPYHKEICTGTKAGSVKGIVSEKDGKKYITPSPGKDSVKFSE